MSSPHGNLHDKPAFTFRDLTAWKLARALASEIYKACEHPKLRNHYSFCDQMGRAGLSIPCNIAEGEDRGTNKDSLHFLRIARGSASELETQLWIARDVGWVDLETYQKLSAQRDEVARVLGGLIRMRQARLRASEA